MFICALIIGTSSGEQLRTASISSNRLAATAGSKSRRQLDALPDEERIFHTSRKLPDSEAQADYLDQICAGDLGLRQRVEALLGVHERESEFLKSNPLPAPTVNFQSSTEAEGQEFGRYKLREKLGEGGFGIVWAAEQIRPVRRRVALKIIKPGMDSRDVIARFEAERQALALMDHPNIAQVFDGGTTPQGRPYFVMELIRGVPITEHVEDTNLNQQWLVLDAVMIACDAEGTQRRALQILQNLSLGDYHSQVRSSLWMMQHCAGELTESELVDKCGPFLVERSIAQYAIGMKKLSMATTDEDLRAVRVHLIAASECPIPGWWHVVFSQAFVKLIDEGRIHIRDSRTK